MRLTAFFIMAACLQVCAAGYAQKITIREKDVPMEKILQEIKAQTGYDFIYNLKTLEQVGNISIRVKRASLAKTLDACFRNTPLSYTITEQIIVINRTDAASGVQGSDTSHRPAPSLTVHGRVTDDSGQPLAGVTIEENGVRGNVTLSDSAGNFFITVKDAASKLSLSHVAYQTKVVPATSRLHIVLVSQRSDLSDVVVIGYQSQARRNVTAAVSSIKGKEIQDIPEASFDQMLQGRLPGVYVQSSTGEPGAKPNITIRGTTNIDYGNANGGNTGPLYVIDGVIFDVNNMSGTYTYSNPLTLIDPADIESIDVLKDASASAIYGARGGNGVIIITTKAARRSQKPQVTASVYYGVVTRPTFKKVATGNAERLLKLELLNNAVPYTDLLNGSIPQALTDSLNPAFNSDVDWQGMLIRSSSAVNNEDVSMSGYFNGNNSYKLSLNHYSEQGKLKGFSAERLAPHLSVSIGAMKHLNITGNIMLSAEKRHHGAGSANTFFYNSSQFPTSLSQLNQTQLDVFSGQYNSYDDNSVFTINGSLKVTDTIAQGLLVTSSFSANAYGDRWDYFSPALVNGVQNIAYHNQANNPGWMWDNYIQYTKKIKKHQFTVVGGEATSMARQYYAYAYAAGISVSGISTLQTVPSGSNLYATTSRQTKTTESFYGRVSYDFDNKYLLMASLRRDASSIYSSNYRWGTFPSVSAGWVVSDENFFKPLKNVVNFWKVRASWGITGMDPGSWYAKYQALSADASFLGATTGTLGGTAAAPSLTGTPSTYNGTTVISPFPYNNNYLTSGTKSSKDVHWEKYPQINIGTDIDLFNDRVVLAVDAYRKDAIGKFLYQIPAQQTTGYLYYSGNYVNIRNEGLEVGLSTRNILSRSGFQWSTSFNIALNRNYITKLPNGNRDMIYGEAWWQKTLTLGRPVFSYLTWLANGVYATDADVPVDPITGKKLSYMGTALQAGDARLLDLNGDYNIDYSDKVLKGDPSPKATGGITNTFMYKGASLTIFCSYSFGNNIINGYLSDALNGAANYNTWGRLAGPAAYVNLLDQFWQQPGDQTRFPRLVYPAGKTSSVGPWNVGRSYFIDNGRFIKLKQVTFAYNLPKNWLSRTGIRNLNVYTLWENLHIWKSSGVPDPELYDPTTGSSNTVYPTALKVTFGLRVDL
ncbi:MAG TPA: SusC/RagA family TonB-linked outer membrane protein [Puia sp.]|nr:SusC/RagA family TonB-linked outer membrane protein [Puia sp.]